MAERHPREQALRRVHGTGALFSTAYGNVGSTVYYALGITAAFALGLTPLAFLVAGIVFICTAATYTEATVMYPEAGGSSNFARHAFNEMASFVAGWGQMLNYIITIAISAFFAPHYLAVFWGWLGHGPGDVIAGIVLIALLAVLNVRGTQESTRLNLFLAIGDLLTQIGLVVIGIAIALSPETLVNNVELGVAPTWGNFALGIAVAMIAYTGIETISNMAEEARDASRTVARGTGLTVVAVLTLYSFLPLIALSVMPVTQNAAGDFTTALGTTYTDNPVLGIIENLGLGAGATDVMRAYVGVLAAIILVVATNAALIGVSRLIFSMGQYRQLPDRLRRVHPRFRTPYLAILIFSAISAVVMLPGEPELLATMYSFGAMLSFTVAHVSLIRLRQRRPEVERPWRMPLNVRAFGFDLPLLAVLGGFGTFAAWIVVMALNLRTLALGLGWMAIGMVVYVVYRRRLGLPMTQTVKVVMPEPLGVEEIEYKSVLVAFEDSAPFDEEVVATAVKLASRRRRGIHVYSLLTVPTHLPLDARLEEQESAAQSKIEQAKLIGGMRVKGHIERVRPSQAGHMIADEARRIEAAALVMGLTKRRGAGPAYDKTLRTVLAERPCRVLIVSEPEDQVQPAPSEFVPV